MKIMAVDDQAVVLQMLRDRIDLKQLGLSRMDTALSAKMARELLKKDTYDVILCDIEMPEEDGITFARWIREVYPEIKIIFLTSHMDFNYMKQAISMHSFDYILQPAQTIELNQVIQKAIFAIQIERKQRELQKHGQVYQRQETEIRNWMIFRYLTEGIPMDLRVLEDMRIKFSGCHKDTETCMLWVKVVSENKSFYDMETALAEFVLENILDELINDTDIHSFFFRKNKEEFLGILYSGKNNLDMTEIRQALTRLDSYLQMLFQMETAIFFNDTMPMKEVREQYEKLDKYIRTLVNIKGQITFIGSKTDRDNTGDSLEMHAGNWKKLIRREKFDELEKSVTHYIQKLMESSVAEYYDVIHAHMKFTEILFSYLTENEISINSIFTEDFTYSDFMSMGIQADQFQVMVSYIIKKLKETASVFLDPIALAKQYIKEHVSEELSVTTVADYVALTPEHLTRLLKKETGYSLKEYLTHERLEAAKMLLRTTSLSVTLVASHVGYENYNNFTKIFRKYEGCTPSEYRKKCEKNA